MQVDLRWFRDTREIINKVKTSPGYKQIYQLTLVEMLAKNKVISKQYGKNNNKNGGKSIIVEFYFWKMMHIYKSMFYKKVKKKKNRSVLKSNFPHLELYATACKNCHVHINVQTIDGVQIWLRLIVNKYILILNLQSDDKSTGGMK